ncbi:MAG: hypothetical protein WCF57_06515 [Pyrinomonadaceae bacterium]
MVDKTSLYKLSGLPESIAVIIFSVLLILFLSPYLASQDIGLFKIPQFTKAAKQRLKIIGPVLLVMYILYFIPLIEIASSPTAHLNGEPKPTVTPTVSPPPATPQPSPVSTAAPTPSPVPEKSTPPDNKNSTGPPPTTIKPTPAPQSTSSAFYSLLTQARNFKSERNYADACRKYQAASRIIPESLRRTVKTASINEANSIFAKGKDFSEAAKQYEEAFSNVPMP